jgi:hypothetical protein
VKYVHSVAGAHIRPLARGSCYRLANIRLLDPVTKKKQLEKSCADMLFSAYKQRTAKELTDWFGISRFESSRPSQAFMHSAALTKRPENSPEIPAFSRTHFGLWSASSRARGGKRRKSLAFSRIFPLWRTLGGDRFDHDCRPTVEVQSRAPRARQGRNPPSLAPG